MAEKLAAEGRGADSEVAHITPGEMVIPRVFQTPEVLAALAKVAAAQGVPLDRFRVGDARNRINPETGAPEFGFVDWIKGVPRQLFNAATPVQAYIAEPFESEKSTAVVLPPGGASMPPATAPSDTSLGYDPNGPGLFGAVKADPMGAAQALWHAGRAWQEARDRYEGGPAATTLYNGEGDAWKHARWNQRMVNAIGPERAKTFADFHERGPDNPVGERGMDLFNNQVGRTLEGDTSRMTIDELIRTGRLKTSPY